MNDCIRIRIDSEVMGEIAASEIRIDPEIWSRSFAKLPRNREIPWEIRDGETAMEMQRFRRSLAEDIGRQLAAKLLELVESKDPHYGYSPEEWAQMQRDAA